jgi:hypothetical protein
VGDGLADRPRPLVECHSGHEYAERPTALRWEGRRVEVERVEAEWRFPGGKRFRVRTQEGQTFELSYNQSTDEWQVVPV